MTEILKMAVEEIVFDRAINVNDSLILRESIECPLRNEERHHLFHQIGLVSRFFRNYFIFPLMSVKDRLNSTF